MEKLSVETANTRVLGQTAIITGAAQGIGAETAATLAREGCKVIIADLDAGVPALNQRHNNREADLKTVKAEKTAEVINSDGGRALAVSGDVTNDEYINHLVKKSVEYSGGKIHIIINNAGYAWDDPIEKISDEQWGKLPP